jgi:hypothetical protein
LTADDADPSLVDGSVGAALIRAVLPRASTHDGSAFLSLK